MNDKYSKWILQYAEHLTHFSNDELFSLVTIQGQNIGQNINPEILLCAPPTPEDMLVWRAGRILSDTRKYLSASTVKEVSMRFGEPRTIFDWERIIYGRPKAIFVPAGSLIIPMLAVNIRYFGHYGDPEDEILLLKDDISRFGFKYRYNARGNSSLTSNARGNSSLTSEERRGQ